MQLCLFYFASVDKLCFPIQVNSPEEKELTERPESVPQLNFWSLVEAERKLHAQGSALVPQPPEILEFSWVSPPWRR